MDKKNEIFEIDLMQILRALWNRVWAVILAAAIGAAIFFSYATFGITPLYSSEVLLYVNNSSFSVGSTSFSISSSQISAAQDLVSTYLVILKARATLNDVIDEADLDYSYGTLKNMISASSVNGTEIFRVSVTSSSPEEAEKIANTIADILPNKIADIVDGSSVRIVDYAVVPSSKSSPNITTYTAIGMLVGFAVACAVVILLEVTDTQIHSEDYLLETYELPVLAVIPDLTNKRRSGYYYYSGKDYKNGYYQSGYYKSGYERAAKVNEAKENATKENAAKKGGK